MKKQEETRSKDDLTRSKLNSTKRKQRRWTIEEKEAFGRMYVEGKSLYEIEKEFNGEPLMSTLSGWKRQYAWEEKKQAFAERAKAELEREAYIRQQESLSKEKAANEEFFLDFKNQLRVANSLMKKGLEIIQKKTVDECTLREGIAATEAANKIINRLIGEPDQKIEAKMTVEKASDLRELSDEELRRRREEAKRDVIESARRLLLEEGEPG